MWFYKKYIKMETNSTINILALSKVNGIGPVILKKNMEKINLYKNDVNGLFSTIANKILKNEIVKYLDYANKLYEFCDLHNIKILTINDNEYPKLLLEIKDPPKTLFYKGELSNLYNAVGIIGTRKSTKTGNLIANRIANYFSEKFSICNGFAEGIDTNSIDIDNKIIKNTIGVVSGGLDFENSTVSKFTRKLSEKALENYGLIISEMEPTQKENKFSLIKACRIQAGLSKSLILIQSSETGGSRFTLKSFCETKRSLGVIDYSKSSEFSNNEFGANRLILEKQIQGVAKFCEITDIEKIRLSKIIKISEKKDYELIENEIKKVANI